MDQKETFEKVIEILDNLKAEFLITGGFAVSFWGHPRSTHDLDILIKIKGNKEKLINSFREHDFYISEEAVEDAIRDGSMFNIIHSESDLKIDFWVTDNNPDHDIEFKRKVQKNFLGKEVYLISPEDLILTKLEWFKKSNSTRHLIDASGIWEIQQDVIDLDYLKKRVVALDLAGLFDDLIANKYKDL